MIKNLITGIGGFVASHLADLLIEKGEEVIGTYRWTEDLSNIEHIRDKIKLVPMDLNDAWSCLKTIEENKPDYIFHLAAQSYVSDSFAYPAETFRTNSLGTLNLLEAIRTVKKGICTCVEGNEQYDPIIHVCSSSEVYGLVTPDLVPIKETCRFNPSNPYAVSKVGADMLALMYFTNYGLKTIRTRMFTHTSGRRKMMSAENFYAKRVAEIEREQLYSPKEEYVIKLGNMSSIRTWADARDAVRAYYDLVHKCTPGEVYNIGGDTTKTIQEVLDYLLSISKVDVSKVKMIVDSSLLRPYDVTLQIPDCSKFKNETDWKPAYTFEQTMQDLLEAWRKRLK